MTWQCSFHIIYYCRNDAIQFNKKSIADLWALVKLKKTKSAQIHKNLSEMGKKPPFPVDKTEKGW